MDDQLHELKSHMDSRFDRIETKIDDHMERLSKAEEAINWLKGHVKFTTSLFIAVVGSLVAAYFSLTK